MYKVCFAEQRLFNTSYQATYVCALAPYYIHILCIKFLYRYRHSKESIPVHVIFMICSSIKTPILVFLRCRFLYFTPYFVNNPSQLSWYIVPSTCTFCLSTCVILSTDVGMPSIDRGGNSCMPDTSWDCGTCSARVDSKSCRTTDLQFLIWKRNPWTVRWQKSTGEWEDFVVSYIYFVSLFNLYLWSSKKKKKKSLKKNNNSENLCAFCFLWFLYFFHYQFT